MSACQNGHLEIVRELCTRGTNVNAARTDLGVTSLMLSSVSCHLEVTRLLLLQGADKSPAATDGLSFTAFSLATGPHKAALQAILKP